LLSCLSWSSCSASVFPWRSPKLKRR
jgi:hypothetical protein